jgi:prepilin-type N-terminal cleavage/methylation domain-containing protein
MLSIQPPVRRLSRYTERGFTLLEILVSLSVLALVAGAIAAAFTVGLAALAPGGSQARLAGAHDLSFLEQMLGKDGARAACITANGTVYGKWPTTSATCTTSTGYGQVAACRANGSATLCFGWPQLAGTWPSYSSSYCEIAAYSTQPPAAGPLTNVIITRTEYSVTLPPGLVLKQLASTPVDRIDTVQFQVGSAAPAGYMPPGEGYPWLQSLPVTVTATGVKYGSFAQTLVLHPVAGDPDGPAANITSAGSPC